MTQMSETVTSYRDEPGYPVIIPHHVIERAERFFNPKYARRWLIESHPIPLNYKSPVDWVASGGSWNEVIDLIDQIIDAATGRVGP